MDVNIRTDKNIFVKELDKLIKYKYLDIEIQKIHHLETQTVHGIIGALGMIKKRCQKLLDRIPGEPHLKGSQKFVLTSTATFL